MESISRHGGIEVVSLVVNDSSTYNVDMKEIIDAKILLLVDLLEVKNEVTLPQIGGCI